MTEDEADYVLAKLSVSFPSKRLSTEEVHNWASNLAPFDFDQALKAAKSVEDSCKFWPSWAEFREHLGACRETEIYRPALGRGESLRSDEVVALIREARESLK
jgi:hypothetical protein